MRYYSKSSEIFSYIKDDGVRLLSLELSRCITVSYISPYSGTYVVRNPHIYHCRILENNVIKTHY